MIKELVMSILFSCVPIEKIKKWIYPKREFEEDIDFDVRSTNPVSFTLTSQIPSSRIYLKITNKSQYLEAIFDRALFSIWLDSDKGTQPICHTLHIISKQKVGRKRTEEIFCEYDLNESQIKHLREMKESKKLKATLDIKIYLDSLLYNLVKIVRLENIHCEIN